MDYLELLSDEQLRLRLLEYGFPNMPVTQTTRKTLIKKLRNCMANQQGKLKSDTKMVTSFSSEEESDNDSPRRGGRKSGRITASSTPVQKRETFVRPSGMGIHARPSTRARPVYSNVHVSPLIVGDSEDEPDTFNGFTPSPGPNSTGGLRNRYTMASPNTGDTNGYDTNSIADTRKRLMQIRSETLNSNRNTINGPWRPAPSYFPPERSYNPSMDNEIVCQADPIPEPAVTPLNVALTNFMNKLDEIYSVKQTFVPCILLSVLIGFFVLLACMYLTMSPNIKSTLVSEATHHTLCDPSNLHHIPTQNCIDSEHLEPALNLIRTIINELQERAELHKCIDSSHTLVMTVRDLIAYTLDVDKETPFLTLVKTLHNAQYIIAENPQWRIKNVDISGKELEMNTVITLRATETCCLAILDPVLPFTCIIRNKIQKFFLIVGGIGLVVGIFYGAFRGYRYVKFMKQLRKDQVNALINEITSNLIQQAMKAKQDPNEEGCIIVTHLRDKLVPPVKRKELEWAWNEALRFLECHESRISFEVGNRNGEDCRLMRWIDTSTISPQPSPNTSMISEPPSMMIRSQPSSAIKVWQSPGIPKANKIKDPPTPCLKIRQMFDKYDTNDPNLKQIIQDAILAKVGNSCRIYDVQLDQQSLCTYVRCASSEDAGMVHDEINGWWFDGRLVSIKFLRLERYSTRFPNSHQGPATLRPLSLASLQNQIANNNSQMSNGEDDELND